MKKTLVPIVLTTVMIGLSGCANRNNYVGPNNHVNQNNVRSTNQGGPAALNNADRNLRVSNKARNSVESMREVDRAHVIIQNNNAYVAVRLKNNGNLAGNGTSAGTAAPGAAGTNTGTYGTGANTGTGYGAPAPITGGDGTTSMGTGTTTGINGAAGGNGTTAGTAGAGGTNNGRTIGSNGYGAAGTNLTPGTPGATGTTGTPDNRNYRPVTTSLDKKIENRVRSAEHNINRVYVSYDTDFYNRMGTYSNDLLNGRNRDGIFRDFTNTVRGMFR